MPTRLENIEEFELASRVPRSAITGEILKGVRQLNEPREIEPFLREIISDKTATPHTSTEIADILTTHLTCAGKPYLAAFVNKGKSYPKVTSKEIAHQIVRLQDIPGIGLAILLAVGDIHDDAKKVLIKIADNAKAEYMIIDAIDVARLFIAYHKICPNDGTPYSNGKCNKCGSLISDQVELTLRTYEEPSYTILSQEEDGKNLLRKYSVEILTDPHYQKQTLREVIKKATRELLHNNNDETHFAEHDVGRIYLFIYLDLRDRQHANWICRALWINPNLPKSFRPLDLGGNERLGEIEIDWNPQYRTMHDFFLGMSDTKQKCVDEMDHNFREVEEMKRTADNYIEEYYKGRLQRDQFQKIMAEKEILARKLFMEIGDQNFPPLECAECNQILHSMTCGLHNIFLPFAKGIKADWSWDNKLWLVRDAQKGYEEDKDRFNYERKKLK